MALTVGLTCLKTKILSKHKFQV